MALAETLRAAAAETFVSAPTGADKNGAPNSDDVSFWPGRGGGGSRTPCCEKKEMRDLPAAEDFLRALRTQPKYYGWIEQYPTDALVLLCRSRRRVPGSKNPMDSPKKKEGCENVGVNQWGDGATFNWRAASRPRLFWQGRRIQQSEEN